MITKTKIVFFFVIIILLSYSSMKKEKEVPSERALSLKCNVIKINDKTLNFVVEATRLRLDSVEVFASTEYIRLIILDEHGKTKWRSDNKYAVGSAISKPLPDTVGKTYNYNIEWYGNDDANNILVTGKYKVQVILPCRPKPYVIEMDLDWKNPYDRQ
jgi:hypothetical protein